MEHLIFGGNINLKRFDWRQNRDLSIILRCESVCLFNRILLFKLISNVARDVFWTMASVTSRHFGGWGGALKPRLEHGMIDDFGFD